MSDLVETPYKLTLEEMLCSAAATLYLLELRKIGSPFSSISEMCYIPQYGFTASASLERCGPRFVRITDIKGGTINWNMVPFCECPDPSGYELKSGDILIARSGSIGKSFFVRIVPEVAVFASYMIRLRTKPDFTPSFVYWCLQSQQFWQQISEAKRGSAMNNINGKMLSSLKFPAPSRQIQDAITSFLDNFKKHLTKREETQHLAGCPSFLYEPQWIVARIEELAARIEEARGLRRKAVEEVEIMHRQIYGLIWQEADKKSLSTNLLEQVADVIDPQPDHRTPAEVIGGMPYVSITNISIDGKVNVLRARKVSPTAIEHQESSFTIKTGDIVLGKIGTIGAARPIIVDQRFALSANVVLVQPDRNKILDRFLLALLRSPQLEEQITVGTRLTAQGAFGIKKMRKLVIPLPPLSEQYRIADHLDILRTKVNSLKQLQSETSAELDTLLPSILDKAFKGEL